MCVTHVCELSVATESKVSDVQSDLDLQHIQVDDELGQSIKHSRLAENYDASTVVEQVKMHVKQRAQQSSAPEPGTETDYRHHAAPVASAPNPGTDTDDGHHAAPFASAPEPGTDTRRVSGRLKYSSHSRGKVSCIRSTHTSYHASKTDGPNRHPGFQPDLRFYGRDPMWSCWHQIAKQCPVPSKQHRILSGSYDAWLAVSLERQLSLVWRVCQTKVLWGPWLHPCLRRQEALHRHEPPVMNVSPCM